jgi:hypothetical protein
VNERLTKLFHLHLPMPSYFYELGKTRVACLVERILGRQRVSAALDSRIPD